MIKRDAPATLDPDLGAGKPGRDLAVTFRIERVQHLAAVGQALMAMHEAGPAEKSELTRDGRSG